MLEGVAASGARLIVLGYGTDPAKVKNKLMLQAGLKIVAAQIIIGASGSVHADGGDGGDAVNTASGDWFTAGDGAAGVGVAGGYDGGAGGIEQGNGVGNGIGNAGNGPGASPGGEYNLYNSRPAGGAGHAGST